MKPIKKEQELSLRQAMDHLFDRAFTDPFTAHDHMRRMLDMMPSLEVKHKQMPQMDISESKKGHKVQVSLPGYDAEDVTVDIHEGELTIEALMKEEKSDKDEKWHRKEMMSGSFHHRMQLPSTIDEDKVTADMKNGKLSIMLPFKKQEKSKKKSVKVKKK